MKRRTTTTRSDQRLRLELGSEDRNPTQGLTIEENWVLRTTKILCTITALLPHLLFLLRLSPLDPLVSMSTTLMKNMVLVAALLVAVTLGEAADFVGVGALSDMAFAALSEFPILSKVAGVGTKCIAM